MEIEQYQAGYLAMAQTWSHCLDTVGLYGVKQYARMALPGWREDFDRLSDKQKGALDCLLERLERA